VFFYPELMARLPPVLNGLIPFIRDQSVSKSTVACSFLNCILDLRRRFKIHIRHPHRKLIPGNVPFYRRSSTPVNLLITIIIHTLFPPVLPDYEQNRSSFSSTDLQQILVFSGSILSFSIISSPISSAQIVPPDGFRILSTFPVISAFTVEYSNASVVFSRRQFFITRLSM